jgi:uncharacterized membrane protein
MRFSLTEPGKLETAILIFLTLWFVLTIIVPFTLPADSVKDLSGAVGRIDNADTTSPMNPLANAIYTIGDAYCHQISERSYYLNGNQMPFCARDEGIFLGLVIGMTLAIITRYEIKVIYFILGIVPIGVDGLAQLLTNYESTNPIRLITGLLAGVVVALLVSVFIREITHGQKSIESKSTDAEGKRR